MDINFQVKNQIIRRTDNNSIVQLSENYLKLNFEFSDDWEDLAKFILIKHAEGTTRMALVDDSIIVPSEFLGAEKLNFSVYGVNKVDETVTRITTNKVGLLLLDTGYTTEYTEDIDRSETDLVEEIYLAIDSKADLIHTHTKSDITDFSHTHTESEITDLGDYSVVGHKHVKSDITDFNHTHTKSDISDFAHNHDDRYYTESETDTLLNAKSDTGHNHDNRYYTEDEVDAIIADLKHDLDNKIIVQGDKDIIQTGDRCDVIAYVVKDGMPAINKDVYFYVKEESNVEE